MGLLKNMLGGLGGAIVGGLIVGAAAKAIKNSEDEPEPVTASGAPAPKSSQTRTRIKYRPTVVINNKCSFCNTIYEKSLAKCPACGATARISVNCFDVNAFLENYSLADTIKKKIRLVKNLVIYDDIDSIDQIYLLACSNSAQIINNNSDDEDEDDEDEDEEDLIEAWVKKKEEAYKIAELKYPTSSQFNRMKAEKMAADAARAAEKAKRRKKHLTIAIVLVVLILVFVIGMVILANLPK